MQISVEETLLIDAIEEVRFGKLLDVSIPYSEPTIHRNLRIGNGKLINRLREDGIVDLVSITVHEGEAQQIEVAGEKNGFKFIKKIKL